MRRILQQVTLLLLTSLLLCGWAIATVAQAQTIPAYDMQAYDKEINNLYKQVSSHKKTLIADRIAVFSNYFLNRPYLLGANGEGPKGEFDQSPLYRTDAFDCVTFVNTVLALAESSNLAQFKQAIIYTNYQNGVIAYTSRNHFTSVDWNPQNQHNGFLMDITHQFIDASGNPVAEIADTIINKPNWFTKLNEKNIKLLKNVSDAETTQLVNALRAKSQLFTAERSVMLYLPLNKLFSADGEANMTVFDQIPSGSVIEIVRPNRDLTSLIGTHLNVSHLGFAIRDQRGLLYREASSEKKMVIDIPLVDYLRNYLKSPTVKGINVQKIVTPNSAAFIKNSAA